MHSSGDRHGEPPVSHTAPAENLLPNVQLLWFAVVE